MLRRNLNLTSLQCHYLPLLFERGTRIERQATRMFWQKAFVTFAANDLINVAPST
jgi:hypothetical protein